MKNKIMYVLMTIAVILLSSMIVSATSMCVINNADDAAVANFPGYGMCSLKTNTVDSCCSYCSNADVTVGGGAGVWCTQGPDSNFLKVSDDFAVNTAGGCGDCASWAAQNLDTYGSAYCHNYCVGVSNCDANTIDNICAVKSANGPTPNYQCVTSLGDAGMVATVKQLGHGGYKFNVGIASEAECEQTCDYCFNLGAQTVKGVCAQECAEDEGWEYMGAGVTVATGQCDSPKKDNHYECVVAPALQASMDSQGCGLCVENGQFQPDCEQYCLNTGCNPAASENICTEPEPQARDLYKFAFCLPGDEVGICDPDSPTFIRVSSTENLGQTCNHPLYWSWCSFLSNRLPLQGEYALAVSKVGVATFPLIDEGCGACYNEGQLNWVGNVVVGAKKTGQPEKIAVCFNEEIGQGVCQDTADRMIYTVGTSITASDCVSLCNTLYAIGWTKVQFEHLSADPGVCFDGTYVPPCSFCDEPGVQCIGNPEDEPLPPAPTTYTGIKFLDNIIFKIMTFFKGKPKWTMNAN